MEVKYWRNAVITDHLPGLNRIIAFRQQNSAESICRFLSFSTCSSNNWKFSTKSNDIDPLLLANKSLLDGGVRALMVSGCAMWNGEQCCAVLSIKSSLQHERNKMDWSGRVNSVKKGMFFAHSTIETNNLAPSSEALSSPAMLAGILRDCW